MMDLHPISNEEEYDAAIVEIEALWGAPTGTPERNRLQILTIIVEAYERVHHPIDQPNPIEALLYAMEKEGYIRRDRFCPYKGVKPVRR